MFSDTILKWNTSLSPFCSIYGALRKGLLKFMIRTVRKLHGKYNLKPGSVGSISNAGSSLLPPYSLIYDIRNSNMVSARHLKDLILQIWSCKFQKTWCDFFPDDWRHQPSLTFYLFRHSNAFYIKFYNKLIFSNTADRGILVAWLPKLNARDLLYNYACNYYWCSLSSFCGNMWTIFLVHFHNWKHGV